MTSPAAATDQRSPPPAVLYINLDRATERRRHVEGELARVWGDGVPTHRILGVDGSALALDEEGRAGALVSPHARYILGHRQLASSHAQLESWGAVGCALSHVRCWDWLLARPPPPDGPRDALILEDDACLAPDFLDTWNGAIRALRAPLHRDWDVLLLGYFQVQGDEPAVVHGVPVRRFRAGASFFGTHGYLITRRGAAICRAHALPLEVQVDAYLLTLQQLGRLRLYLVGAEECVTQCLGRTEPGIDHRYQPRGAACLAPPPPASPRRLLAWCAATLLVLGLVVVWWRGKTRQSTQPVRAAP